jgi:ATP-dependent HslUV protease ATP-binding subunit HslU
MLDLLVPRNLARSPSDLTTDSECPTRKTRINTTRERFRTMCGRGMLDDRIVEPKVTERASNVVVGVPPGVGWRRWVSIEGYGRKVAAHRKKRKPMKVSDALPILAQEEADRLIDMDQIVADAIDRWSRPDRFFR